MPVRMGAAIAGLGATSGSLVAAQAWNPVTMAAAVSKLGVVGILALVAGGLGWVCLKQHKEALASSKEHHEARDAREKELFGLIREVDGHLVESRATMAGVRQDSRDNSTATCESMGRVRDGLEGVSLSLTRLGSQTALLIAHCSLHNKSKVPMVDGDDTVHMEIPPNEPTGRG